MIKPAICAPGREEIDGNNLTEMFTKTNQRLSLHSFLSLDEECREALQKPLSFDDQNKHEQPTSTGSFRNVWNEKNKGKTPNSPHVGERRSSRHTSFRTTGNMGQPEETRSSEFSSKRWSACSSMYCYVDEMKKKSKKLRATRRRHRAHTDGSESTMSAQSMHELDNTFKSVSITQQDETEKAKRVTCEDGIKTATSESSEESSLLNEQGRAPEVDASRSVVVKSSSKVDVRKRPFNVSSSSLGCEIPSAKSRERLAKALSRIEKNNIPDVDASVDIATEVTSSSKNVLPRRDSLRSLALKLNTQTNRLPSELLSKAAMHA
mmetsp:Transcript_896/g.1274  ORF Transcript_896/g.1274 Transcript_896/m.1274 type:complete len:321 (-) Transcript_896:3860-4822(-)